jgi:DNA-directed RNA polymerase specialized sigma24 family protein
MTRRRRDLTAAGAQALAEAQAATDQVRDVRALMCRIAEARRDAVLRANQGGASYGTIAKALGISPGNVQQIVIAARRKGGAG